MVEENEQPGAESDPIVEHGETYEHEKHGCVEVNGIWQGVHRVDATKNMNRNNVVIVNYSVDEGDHPGPELTDTLDEFVEAID